MDHLLLPLNIQCVHLPGCGPDLHLVRPDIVADEIQWVLERLDSSRIGSL